MTLEEFNGFVESFGKSAGEFTKDEIFEIGKAHKQIEPSSKKSWEYVKAIVGWTGTAQSLRMFVNNRINKETPYDQDGELSEYQQQLNTLYKEKTKMRDIRNAIARDLRDEARVEVLKETLVEAIRELPSLPSVSDYYIGNTSQEGIEAILMLSDLHIGVSCNNFYNTYDDSVAALRLSKLARDVANYCKLNNVSKLNVVNLGDLIHGIIHTNARIETQFDAVTQVIVASDLIAQFLNLLKDIAPEVTYRSCSDNHSRMFANKEEAIENENLGRLVDWYLSERLKDTNIKFCDDNIDYSLGKFTLLNGKKVMFAHGHSDTINKSFENFIGASKEFIDIGLLGHYHSNKTKTYNGFRIFVNGSIVGTEQYALSKRLFSEPEQKLLIFDNANNIIDININLKVQ